MEESYIRDYIVNLFENTYSNDLERLNAIKYGLDYILNSISSELETNEEKHAYNQLTTCYLTIAEIVEEEKEKEALPF